MAKKKLETEKPHGSNDPLPMVRAHLLLRGGSATLGSLEGITADSKPSPGYSHQLEQLGFNVISSSPLAISVEASPETFHTVFGSKVLGRKQTGSTKALNYQAPTTIWSFREPPQIPLPLKEFVQEVIFPAAVSLHSQSNK